jgi:hypothetical protein
VPLPAWRRGHTDLALRSGRLSQNDQPSFRLISGRKPPWLTGSFLPSSVIVTYTQALSPSDSAIYVDDATVSLVPIGPDAQL